MGHLLTAARQHRTPHDHSMRCLGRAQGHPDLLADVLNLPKIERALASTGRTHAYHTHLTLGHRQGGIVRRGDLAIGHVLCQYIFNVCFGNRRFSGVHHTNLLLIDIDAKDRMAFLGQTDGIYHAHITQTKNTDLH
jgi:hypothetical protein